MWDGNEDSPNLARIANALESLVVLKNAEGIARDGERAEALKAMTTISSVLGGQMSKPKPAPVDIEPAECAWAYLKTLYADLKPEQIAMVADFANGVFEPHQMALAVQIFEMATVAARNPMPGA